MRDAGPLAARLQNDPNPGTRPISDFVWHQFSRAGQAALRGTGASSSAVSVVLAEELNHCLHGRPLYDHARLAALPLSEAARTLAATPPATGTPALPNQTLLLNRLLLEDAYPEAIPHTHHAARVALAQDMTRLINSGSCYERAETNAIALSPAARELHARSPQGRALVRLNRMVLEDAFPSALALNRLGVPGSVSPYYVMIFLFIVLLSVGESIYSPRLYEYAAVIAPKGQEGSYMSLSYLPFFLAKLLVASFSGILLARFCPESGPRHAETLWLIIALTTLIAPAGLFLLGRFIRVPEAGREA